MWMRVGGRYSSWIAWGALLGLVAPAVILSVVYRSLIPIAFVAGVLAIWVLASIVALIPIIVLKLSAMFRSRPIEPGN